MGCVATHRSHSRMIRRFASSCFIQSEPGQHGRIGPAVTAECLRNRFSGRGNTVATREIHVKRLTKRPPRKAVSLQTDTVTPIRLRTRPFLRRSSPSRPEVYSMPRRSALWSQKARSLKQNGQALPMRHAGGPLDGCLRRLRLRAHRDAALADAAGNRHGFRMPRTALAQGSRARPVAPAGILIIMPNAFSARWTGFIFLAVASLGWGINWAAVMLEEARGEPGQPPPALAPVPRLNFDVLLVIMSVRRRSAEAFHQWGWTVGAQFAGVSSSWFRSSRSTTNTKCVSSNARSAERHTRSLSNPISRGSRMSKGSTVCANSSGGCQSPGRFRYHLQPWRPSDSRSINSRSRRAACRAVPSRGNTHRERRTRSTPPHYVRGRP